jgi:hypothetical protein
MHKLAMAFSFEEIGRIDHVVGDWCIHRVPPEVKRHLDYDYEVQGQAVTLFEVRPFWRGAPGESSRSPFVKIRYVKSSRSWQIYWMRASGKWHAYGPDPTAVSIEDALQIIEADSYGCFFG